MKPIRQKLKNGAELFYISTDRFKTEYLSMVLTLPLEKRLTQQSILVEAVLRRGTRSYPTLAALNRRLDELFSTSISTRNRRVGDVVTLRFSLDLLSSRFVGGGKGVLPEALSVLSELLFSPLLVDGRFSAAYTAQEILNLKNAIRAEINNPREFAVNRCRELLCAGEPAALSLLGTLQEADEVTPEALTERWQHMMSTVRPVFFFVGSVDMETVAREIEEKFPHFVGNGVPYASTVKPWTGKHSFVEQEMPLGQGKLCLGFRTDVGAGHPLAPATQLMNEIFGGSPASKLFLNVREKRSLCYHCSAALDGFKGIILASSGIRPENREITENAMLSELQDIKEGRITATEMQAAHRAYDNYFKQMTDSPAALAEYYYRRSLIGDIKSLEERRAALAAVTLDDVVEAASHVTHGVTYFLKGTLDEGVADDED